MPEDPLRKLIPAIEKSMSELALAMYSAADLSFVDELEHAEPDLQRGARDRVISWDEDGNHGHDWDLFLRSAKAQGANVVYLNVSVFSWQRDMLESLDRTFEADPDEVERRKTLAKEYRKYDGHVERIMLAFRDDTVWHVARINATWRDDYIDVVAVEEGQGETHREERPEDEQLDSKQCDDFARELIAGPDFGDIDGDVVRRRLCRAHPELRGNDTQIDQVVQAASDIYDDEIKPEKEKDLVKRARLIMEQGKSQKTAADHIGLSPKELGKLLNKYVGD